MVKFSIKTSLVVLFWHTVSEAGASVLVVPWFFADKEGRKEGRNKATTWRRVGGSARRLRHTSHIFLHFR